MKILTALLFIVLFGHCSVGKASGEPLRHQTASDWAGYSMSDIDDLVEADVAGESNLKQAVSGIFAAANALFITALAAIAAFVCLFANRLVRLAKPKVFYEDDFQKAIEPYEDGRPAGGVAQAIAIRIAANVLGFALIIRAFATVFAVLYGQG